ncbi:hypothetical protein [Bradyrhizobium sp. S3.5.5]|uniref:hypothetical protein n=1 Tax=Bradyrhizobium sp. S3.5.5 TaxID=3156430 RepID=UPI0033951BB3
MMEAVAPITVVIAAASRSAATATVAAAAAAATTPAVAVVPTPVAVKMEKRRSGCSDSATADKWCDSDLPFCGPATYAALLFETGPPWRERQGRAHRAMRAALRRRHHGD